MNTVHSAEAAELLLQTRTATAVNLLLLLSMDYRDLTRIEISTNLSYSITFNCEESYRKLAENLKGILHMWECYATGRNAFKECFQSFHVLEWETTATRYYRIRNTMKWWVLLKKIPRHLKENVIAWKTEDIVASSINRMVRQPISNAVRKALNRSYLDGG